MDKEYLKKISQTKERFTHIMELRKKREYEKIFELYGQRIFSLVVPRKYKKNDVKSLMKQGRFEDVYIRYGARVYEKNIYKMQAVDVYNEIGSKPKSIFNRIKNTVMHRFLPTALAGMLALPTTSVATLAVVGKQIVNENAQEYIEEIERYDKKINEYAENIRSMNLTDIQIIMKVVSDMWNGIEGYCDPNGKDALGFERLYLYENRIGICRNMADDVTVKLNAINPEYNARKVAVKLNQDSNMKLADIERRIIQSNNTVVDNDDGRENSNQEQENQDGNVFRKLLTNILGDHLVTAIDIPNKNVTLIIDSTNPSIGVFYNGKIYMFAAEDGKFLQTRILGQIVRGENNWFSVESDILESFLPSSMSLEELEAEYGLESQNKALEYLESLEQSEFDRRILVDLSKKKENPISRIVQDRDKNVSDELDR